MRNHTFFISTLISYLTAMIMMISVPANAADDEMIKLLYAYKFSKFVEWPNTFDKGLAHAGFCILGTHQFGVNIESTLANASFKGLPIEVKRYDKGLLPDEALTSCQILFFSRTNEKRIQGILNLLTDKPILTVSDSRNFINSGGMIELFESNQKILFKINNEAITRAGLTVSSKLLELAKSIQERSDD